MVLLFHSFARWTELVPYGTKYSSIPVIQYGYLGVPLFFMIMPRLAPAAARGSKR